MRHDDNERPAEIGRRAALRGVAGIALGVGMFGAAAGRAAASPAGFVRDLTGDATAGFGFRGTDLGYTAKTRHGYCISIFGDTFDTPLPSAAGWRSPVGLRQSNADIGNGIRWDNCIGGGRAKKMIPYDPVDDETARNTPGQPRTEIPNDLIHLPDGRYIMTTFGVRDWADPSKGGIPSAGGSWRTWYSRMWTSTETNAEDWVRTWNLDTNQENMDFWNSGDLWSHFQNNSMVFWEQDNMVYIYGTNEGRWLGGGIHLMRVPWDQMWRPSAYTFWGQDGSGRWDWRPNGPSTPILLPPSGQDYIGEISAQIIDGQFVLSYVNGRFGASTVVSQYPTGLWTAPRTQVSYQQADHLYSPCVHPYSTLGSAQILLSQWNADFYGVRQWTASITGQRLARSGAIADQLVVTSQEPAYPGHQGPLSPQWQRLPAADQIALLSDNTDNRVSRDDIAAAARRPR